MKRVLCIIISLNLVGRGEAFADDSLTGLHVGFGLNVFADEYKSDVDVLAIVNSGEPTPARWEFSTSTGDEHNGNLTNKLFYAIISHNDPTNSKTMLELYQKKHNLTETLAKEAFKSEKEIGNDVLCNIPITYIPRTINGSITHKNNQLKRSSIMCGGEIKMTYFHQLYGILNAGIDVSGNINKRRKLNIGFIETSDPESNYNVIGYKRSASYAVNEPDSEYDGNSITNYFSCFGAKTRVVTTGSCDDPNHTHDYVFKEILEGLTSSNDKNSGDVSFEKNKFNSRAAVVLGAQYKGWFAGVRGGVSYNQGKIHVKDSTGTSSEEISFASPFVGVHLMKSVNMKGLENGHIYVTADVNVENKQKLNMRGIKNVKHNSVNVSLGMTWQIN